MRKTNFSMCGVLIALVLSVVLTPYVHSQGQGLPTREDIQAVDQREPDHASPIQRGRCSGTG